jgi:hypothetical protein
MRLAKIVTGMIVLVLAISACNVTTPGGTVIRGSGNVTTEDRAVSGFTEVLLAGAGDLSIEVTGSESLSIEAEDNLLPKITTVVSNNRLTIGAEENITFAPTKPVKYRLTVKDLKQLDVSGAGNITVGDLNGGTFKMNVSGAGNITPTGSIDTLDLVMSGAGNFGGENLACTHAKVNVSGVGNATVKVSDTLDARLSGVGSVFYIGNPQVTKEVSGLGTVEQRSQGNQ